MPTPVPYSAFLVVPCPTCRATVGVNCTRPDGSPVKPRHGRELGEEFGAHLARGDVWFRESRRLWAIEHRGADKGRITYAVMERVQCPKCKAKPGTRCDVTYQPKRHWGEDHGIHAARIDLWNRLARVQQVRGRVAK